METMRREMLAEQKSDTLKEIVLLKPVYMFLVRVLYLAVLLTLSV